MRSTLGGAVALLASTALTAAGLTAGSAAADVPAKPAKVVVKIDAKRVVTMPKTIRPGLTSFVVSTAIKSDSDFQLAVPDEGYTRQQFVSDYNKGGAAAIDRLQNNLTYLGGTDAYYGYKGVAKIAVPDGGKVWAFDHFAQKQSLARVTVATVTGEPSSVAPVTGNGPVVAVGSAEWSDLPSSVPAAGDLLFDNRSGANTDLQIYKLEPGKTVEDFGDWVADPVNVAFPLNLKWYTLTGVMSDGRTSAIRYALKPGSYVVTSGWYDEEGERLQNRGMYRGIELTDPSGRQAARAEQPARPASSAPFTRWANERR